MPKPSSQTRRAPHQQTAHSYGLIAESLVVCYLQESNYTILDRNFIIHGAEIDIIAQKENQLHFIEVKSSASYNTDLTALITAKKQKAITKAARTFLSKHNLEAIGQFDVALVHKHRDITYLENAFYADV